VFVYILGTVTPTKKSCPEVTEKVTVAELCPDIAGSEVLIDKLSNAVLLQAIENKINAAETVDGLIGILYLHAMVIFHLKRCLFDDLKITKKACFCKITGFLIVKIFDSRS
jgi:hypothetical protein